MRFLCEGQVYNDLATGKGDLNRSERAFMQVGSGAALDDAEPSPLLRDSNTR